MAFKYRLEIEVVVGEENSARPIEVARTAYNAHGGVSALVDGEERAIPADRFITCTEQALMELVEGNPLFEQAGINIDRVSCRREEVTPQQPEEPEIPLEDELDEEDSGVYLCRWPNGDFSIVMADSKREAIITLDEWDAARPSWLMPMDTCMIDFRLNARGRIEFTQFGFETAAFVWKSCYRSYRSLLELQGGPYRVHEGWSKRVENGKERPVEQIGEVIRASLIECRTRGLQRFGQFLDALERHKERLA